MRSRALTSVIVTLSVLSFSACSSSKSAVPAGTEKGSPSSLAPSDTGAVGATKDTTVVTAVGNDDSVRKQILAQVIDFGGKGGMKLDVACVTGIIAQLSAADLQKFRENFNSPKVSAEGNALGNKILGCDTSKPTSTT